MFAIRNAEGHQCDATGNFALKIFSVDFRNAADVNDRFNSLTLDSRRWFVACILDQSSRRDCFRNCVNDFSFVKPNKRGVVSYRELLAYFVVKCAVQVHHLKIVAVELFSNLVPFLGKCETVRAPLKFQKHLFKRTSLEFYERLRTFSYSPACVAPNENLAVCDNFLILVSQF